MTTFVFPKSYYMTFKTDPFDLFRDYLVDNGASAGFASFVGIISLTIVVFIAGWLMNYLAKHIINRVVTKMVLKSTSQWDDIFLENKVFSRMSHIFPAAFIWIMAAWALQSFPLWVAVVQKMAYLYIIIVGTLVGLSFIESWHQVYLSLPLAQHRHIKGYVQLVKLLVVIIAGLFIISIVFKTDVRQIVLGMGAMAAVLILVFKDTILGLVASIQLSANNMVQVGDWITIPSRGADGTVLDITLNTVKVQNWDKTISMVPTYALVSESFNNWRGMEESGGRRIKRSINIDIKSVRFLDKKLRDRLYRIQLLRPYLDEKEAEINKYNAENNIDDSSPANGRRLTNLGTFRVYAELYLANHPKMRSDMTLLVRQKQPTEHGIPIELYAFSQVQDLVPFEIVQSDIFDHLVAVVPEFGLAIFQKPTGDDFSGREI